jgi:hypothetical protein
MVNFDEAKRSVAIEREDFDGHRTDGDFQAVCPESARGPDRTGNHITGSVGERWKASVTRACILAPCAATLLLRAAWCTPCQSWMRSVRLYRAGSLYR